MYPQIPWELVVDQLDLRSTFLNHWSSQTLTELGKKITIYWAKVEIMKTIKYIL